MYKEEHDMAKNIDRQLLIRLLHYAKKHYLAIGFSLFLLFIVVGVDLVRPIIIGKAIDEVMTDYSEIYTETDDESALEVEGRLYELDQDLKDKGNTKGTIVYSDEGYYFVGGLTLDEAEGLIEEVSVEHIDGQVIVSKEGRVYDASLLTTDVVDELRKNDYSDLAKYIIWFLIVLIVGLAVGYYQIILLNYTGQKIIYEIRDEIFAHLQGLSVEFFNLNPVGKLVTRVTNDTETLNEMYTSVIVNSVKSVLTLVGISVMMFVLNWKLALAVFGVIPIILFATYLFRKYSREAYRDQRTKIAMINTFLSEHISGMKIVQIFTKEKAKLKAFDQINESLLKANMRQLLVFGIYRPSIYFIYVIGLALVLGFGGFQIINGLLTIGVLVTFLYYISNFFDPIQQLSEQFNILQSAFASAEKIFSLLDEKDIIPTSENAKTLDKVVGHIEFRNVTFAYIEGENVLKDISFTVEPGETVAFVGATGAGKTSILNLLSRYYDIQEGEILLDGISIKEIDKHSIRKHVGQMLQDVFLFTGDIAENIKLGDDKITDELMIKSSKHVNAHNFIMKQKDAYNERVYERGATFSAGQRQLLSFARTLAYNPSILVLDEATANIDTETEVLIQDALLKLMEGRTTLVVAHRLSTIQHADKIVVLHKGRIKEVGNHQELLNNKGLYYNLYKLQYQE